jgi:hypothetical protein
MRILIAFLACALPANASGRVPVDSVVATVRAALAANRKDPAIARSVDKVKLSERLEDRVIEILESEGAGPETPGALQGLRDDSRLLPVPAAPSPGMAPPPSSAEQQQVWEDADDKARDYTSALPDFTCTETIQRWLDRTGRGYWQQSPTIVTDLTYFDLGAIQNPERRRLSRQRVDGQDRRR